MTIWDFPVSHHLENVQLIHNTAAQICKICNIRSTPRLEKPKECSVVISRLMIALQFFYVIINKFRVQKYLWVTILNGSLHTRIMRLTGFKHYLSRLAPKWFAKRRSSDTLLGLKPAEDAREQAVVKSCLRALRRTSIALSSSFLHKELN